MNSAKKRAKRRGRAHRSARLYVLASTSVAAGASGMPQASCAPPVDAPEPAFDLVQAVTWRDDMMPLVEQIAGRRFTRVPEIRIVDREGLLSTIVTDEVTMKRALDVSFSEAALERDLRLAKAGAVEFVAGKCRLDDQAVVLAPENVPGILALTGIRETELDGFMRLTMAHELAHALHLQHIDATGQLDAAGTYDGISAWGATLEGFAMLVQRRVAVELHLELLNRRFEVAMGLGPGTELDERVKPSLSRAMEGYRIGSRFLETVHADGGMDRVWSVLADPPVLSRQVREPDRYGQPVSKKISTGRLFRDIAPLLAGDEAREQQGAVRPASLAARYERFGADVVSTVRSAVRMAHMMDLNGTRHSDVRQEIRSLTLYELAGPGADEALRDPLARMREAEFDRGPPPMFVPPTLTV
jgi:hypothetical protein